MASMSPESPRAPALMFPTTGAPANTHVSEHCIVVVVDSSRGADVIDRILQLVQELTNPPAPWANGDGRMVPAVSTMDTPLERAPRGSALTPREHEVVRLVIEGYSNKMIAESLVITERTAETHVRNVREKLGFSSRSQVAAWGMRRRLLGTV